MLFNSLHFAWFFPLVFALYWAIPAKRWTWRNHLLLVASYYFYGCWDWRFLSLIFITSTADFLIGRWMESEKDERKRKWIVFISVFYNIGLLGFFKYFNFFADSLVQMLDLFGIDASFTTLNIVLPVGISFYTFQSLSYTIDIYRRQLPASKDYFSFLTFVAFFPQLVAGPIERAVNLLPQFSGPRHFAYHQAATGLRWILWGLFKKIAVADRLAYFVDLVYADPECSTGPMIITATVIFTFQVYCDFSGYSDIARGTAKLLGFELMVNFKMPLFSTSIREFWNRWHISLSSWFRDYLFHPLGGSKSGNFRWTVNVLIVFLISGLWHGATVNFVIWGLLHGVGYLLESFRKKFIPVKIPAVIGCFFTVGWFTFALMLFRSASLEDSAYLFSNLADFSEGMLPGFVFSRLFLYSAGLIVFMMLIDYAILSKRTQLLFVSLPRPVRWSLYYCLILLLVLFGEFGSPQSFVYFQF